MVQGPGEQNTFRLSSHTPEQFNVMPRTEILFYIYWCTNSMNDNIEKPYFSSRPCEMKVRYF